MNSEQQGSELPTPYKLERAKKQGSVARSMEMTGVVVMVSCLLVMMLSGSTILKKISLLLNYQMLSAGSHLNTSRGALQWLIAGAYELTAALAPIFLVIVIFCIVSILAQIGPVFALEAIKPQWSRINPSQGWKRLFSKKSLLDAAKASAKLIFVAWLMYALIKSITLSITGFAASDVHAVSTKLFGELSNFALKILALIFLFAIIDLLLVKKDFLKKMMMTHREIRDEYKNREGDPRIRAKLRELRKEMLRKASALNKVKGADVIIANPTHVAVALAYTRHQDSAPRLLAKGAGTMAEQIKKIGRAHGIPIVANTELARKIYSETDLDQIIPGETFPVAAKILAWAFAIREGALGVR